MEWVSEIKWNYCPDWNGISVRFRLEYAKAENKRLKQMYANLSLEHEVLKDIIEKKL